MSKIMIYYFYGADSYWRNRKLRDLISQYKKKYSQIDLFSADFESEPESWLRAKEFINQPSIFIDSKVVVIKESGAVPAESEKSWLKVLKSQIETPKTFVLISDSASPKKSFSFLLQKPVKAQLFEELENGTLDLFLKQEAANRELVFSAEAFRFLVSFINAQKEKSWVAVQELDKFALAGFPSPISLGSARAIIYWRERGEVYILARRILETSDKKKKISFLETLFLEKADPAYIFNSLAFQARGENAIELADYDVSIKSGGLDYEEALTEFVIS